MKRLVVLTGLTMVFAGAIAGVAKADTTLGSAAIPAGSDPRNCGGAVIIQATSDPATPYTVPSPPVGPLTSWQVNTTGATAGDPVTLLLLRSTVPDIYSVFAADTQTIPSSAPGNVATFTVPSPIAVSGGEVMALYSPTATFACYFKGGATPAGDSLFSAPTPGTPVVGQGLTIDDDSGPGFTLNVAATLQPQPVPKKKCKKHKKKRSADSAKKKKCKKKKKK